MPALKKRCERLQKSVLEAEEEARFGVRWERMNEQHKVKRGGRDWNRVCELIR